ncbi:phosphatidylinositol mannoside acyltransferase [Schaalia vaccimaxillae]|uniref:phosphatidylinositol mannoside acyltransferase n=1 Tax=Schaalia vaccimaxillae TaxID=183916 RepID=UPI0003B5CBB8|nr:phosphatidylinositol mannoside acyltransferase [Schaalia vaccimaxillae]
MTFSPLAAAFSIVPHLPLGLVLKASDVIADLTTLRGGTSVAMLRKNLTRLTGVQPSKELLRKAVRSHMRNYAEQLLLGGKSGDRLASNVVFNGFDDLLEASQDGPVVLALGHSGSWDRVGAWACSHGRTVLTVAEKLDPPKLFDAFVELREGLGMEIIGAGKNDSVFPALVSRARGRSVIVALLADRDISGSGIEVNFGGQRALVAAGPAALARRLDCPLYVACLSYDHSQAVPVIARADVAGPVTLEGRDAGDYNEVEALTQAWVDLYVPMLEEHPQDWHMMQRVYVEDLDPQRLARARAKHRANGGHP